jgi:hypothetical protein
MAKLEYYDTAQTVVVWTDHPLAVKYGFKIYGVISAAHNAIDFKHLCSDPFLHKYEHAILHDGWKLYDHYKGDGPIIHTICMSFQGQITLFDELLNPATDLLYTKIGTQLIIHPKGYEPYDVAITFTPEIRIKHKNIASFMYDFLMTECKGPLRLLSTKKSIFEDPGDELVFLSMLDNLSN